ncbi:MAG: hypothetical protein H7A51_10910 [Akkermansiaceae bacterium]|nr:hypothetical protein [Akkermansiaceae bacterium]
MRRLITTAVFTAISIHCQAGPDQAAHTQPAASPAAGNATRHDLLRFTNGDTLHGSFLGFGKDHTMLWKNPEATGPIEFSTKKTHRIILNGGQGHQKVAQNSTITLINGDVIPGVISSADDKTVKLTTNHLGVLNIPRDTVSQITPSPYGGKLVYYGPLSTDGWKIVNPPEPKNDDEDKSGEQKKGEEQAGNNKEETDWKHIATAWYAGSNKYSHLVRENALPDKCRLAFKLAWRGALYCNVALHADFAPPAYEGKEDARNNMAATVGHAYVVSISTHSATLYSCTFDEKGKPNNTRIDDAHVSLNLSGQEEAQFEFRIDRANRQLLMYLDGLFKIKWNLGDKYEGLGKALAFRNLRYSNAELRVSDIVISNWNGLKDSAQSMRTPDRDVILLANGVDRFSGTFNHLKDGRISFLGSYNNQLTIPANEVQEVHFASSRYRKIPDQDNDKSVYFYVPPYGRISGVPSRGENGNTKLLSDLLGEVNLNTNYVNIIDFSHQNSLLDIWDDNF